MTLRVPHLRYIVAADSKRMRLVQYHQRGGSEFDPWCQGAAPGPGYAESYVLEVSDSVSPQEVIDIGKCLEDL